MRALITPPCASSSLHVHKEGKKCLLVIVVDISKEERRAHGHCGGGSFWALLTVDSAFTVSRNTVTVLELNDKRFLIFPVK